MIKYLLSFILIINSVWSMTRHTLFIRSDNSLWGFGWGVNGQLGPETGIHYDPVKIDDDVWQCFAGMHHSLYIKNDGSLWGIGANSSDQIGIEGRGDSGNPVKIADEVIAASAGVYSSLFIKKDGSLWTMGKLRGKHETTWVSLGKTPTRIHDSVVSASTGDVHLVYVTSDKKLFGLGWNQWGNLGPEDVTGYFLTPRLISYKDKNFSHRDERVVQAVAGNVHTLFVSEYEKNDEYKTVLRAFGENDYNRGRFSKPYNSSSAFEAVSKYAVPNNYKLNTGDVINPKVLLVGNHMGMVRVNKDDFDSKNEPDPRWNPSHCWYFTGRSVRDVDWKNTIGWSRYRTSSMAAMGERHIVFIENCLIVHGMNNHGQGGQRGNADNHIYYHREIDDVKRLFNNPDYTQLPKINSYGGVVKTQLYVDSKTTLAATVTTDLVDVSPAYQIYGGSDWELFEIGPVTNKLIFKQTPDFDDPHDTDKNNRYNVKVRVNNGALYDEQEYTIVILDAPPKLTIQVKPSNAGTVTGYGTYDDGENATLKASPSNGYIFDNWKLGSKTYTNNPMDYKIHDNADFVANFKHDNNDDDGDGLSNYNEIHVVKTNPQVVDTDGDGSSDGDEVLLGFNPKNTNDKFKCFYEENVKSIFENGIINLKFSSKPQKKYIVQRSLDLMNWHDMSDVITASGTQSQFSMNIPLQWRTKLYLRVVYVP
jgi:hypothetical protein